MGLDDALKRFYYRTMLEELRAMNGSRLLPGISYNSLLYLDIIDMTPDCTVSRLAELLHVSKSAVTIKVKELLKQGLIEKQGSPEDRRVSFLRINPAIAGEFRSYDKAMDRAMRAVKKMFTAEDIGTFCDILDLFSRSYLGGDGSE